ncbi:MAG TPA: hypothetical protein VNH22_17295 [Blastocatellia bacterium]|nr:hypothetical protein [Blastocatellia bacterium]
MEGITPASQLLFLLTLTTTIIIPLVVFMFMIQGERTSGTFVIYRTLPVGCRTLFWSRVLSSTILTAICFSTLYLFYLSFLFSGLIGRDALTSLLLGFPYLFLLFSLGIFSSVCSIALTFNISPQLLPTAVTAISTLLVILPFLLSRNMVGFDGQATIVNYFARYGALGGISLGLLGLSLLIGVVGSWAFSHKRAYV